MPDVGLVFSKEPASRDRPRLARFSTAGARAGVEERNGGRWANPLAEREELAGERCFAVVRNAAAPVEILYRPLRRYTQIEEADCGW